jgi:hypothetical protein
VIDYVGHIEDVDGVRPFALHDLFGFSGNLHPIFCAEFGNRYIVAKTLKSVPEHLKSRRILRLVGEKQYLHFPITFIAVVLIIRISFARVAVLGNRFGSRLGSMNLKLEVEWIEDKVCLCRSDIFEALCFDLFSAEQWVADPNVKPFVQQ